MVGRMPILARHHVVELRSEPVSNRENFVASWHREGASRHEIVLQVDENQAALHRFQFSRPDRGGARSRVNYTGSPCRMPKAFNRWFLTS